MLPGRPLGCLVDPLGCQVHFWSHFPAKCRSRLVPILLFFVCVFALVAQICKRGGSEERSGVRVEKMTILEPSRTFPGGLAPARQLKFSRFRSGPSRHHFWNHFGIKVEPEISTILHLGTQWDHFGCQKWKSNFVMNFGRRRPTCPQGGGTDSGFWEAHGEDNRRGRRQNT